MKHCLAVLVLLLLAACGGGTGSNPPSVGPVQKTVTKAGGSLETGGLRLDIPEGALRKDLKVALVPLEKGGSIARFGLEPAGTLMAKPVNLRFTAAGLPTNAVFAWRTGDQTLIFPSTRSGDTLTARIGLLGYGASGQVQRLSEGEGNLEISLLDCSFRVSQLQEAIRRTDWEQDLERANALFEQLEALQARCTELQIQEFQQRACAAYETAVFNAQVIAADNYGVFRAQVKSLMSAVGLVQLTAANCNTDSTDELLEAKFGQFLIFLRAQKLSLTDGPTERDLREVIRYEGECLLLDLTALCGQFGTSLYPPMLTMMREAALKDCRQEGIPLALSQLMRLGQELGSSGPFAGYGTYSYADLETDINYCTSPSLNLRVFDSANTVPVELPRAAKSLNSGGTAPGVFITRTDVLAPLEGSLNISGNIRLLICPNATPDLEALVLRINGAEIARRPASGNTSSLSTNPFDLLLSRDLPKAGLNPQTTENFTVEIFREGSGCGGLLSGKFKLFSLSVTALPPFRITSFVGPATIRYGGSERYDWRWSGKPQLPVTVRREVTLCELGTCEFPPRTVVNTLIAEPFETWFCRSNSDPNAQPARMRVAYSAVDNLGMTTNTRVVTVTCVR